jgi:hypothetical protein
LTPPIKRKEKKRKKKFSQFGLLFHVYVLPKGKKKDKCRPPFGWSRSNLGHLRMTQIKSGLASDDAPDQIQFAFGWLR